ncbi:VOC family protein [Mesorhizobium sp. M7D.F.Ca.US.005.01.1.1]|jgi:catechol 2,3-dioxygenase-like lactoylglutathione lyase family enzyme|uniref:Catechol 2,3-dioxygenase-like lactoylglutathione lyase family enzyme n=1 Tax=Rhizobium loti TaxID=381 RepID=A0A8E2WBQ7_RHILI|nr:MULTISPECIES: VOC family protein [Mesorhizobium]AZO41075.1 VOC family protein [Mesorhizobium sp. M7D.F.Ca.US.005.01.1.1]PWJ90930.1 catechol 2,3-dioxygenase-like lactoylglutathione lyase family enzyme [Mesorhizobium loti]
METVSVRYIVNDVDEAIAFYGEHLGFAVALHPAPSFAMLAKGNLRLLLNAAGGPGGASQPMPDGSLPEPGGWNRIQIEVEDLEALVAALRHAGQSFRNDIVKGMGGSQILLQDPSGNLVELFEPARR